jgi:hypothetical protein
MEFETDHNSGRLRHPDGGPYVFVAERPESKVLEMYPILGADDAEKFQPPSAGTIDTPFTARHWDVIEMLLRDPDGRPVSVSVPA